MKRCRLSYDDWKCILDKKQIVKYVDDKFFKGYISEITILEVDRPQIWRFNGEDVVVCKKGYRWLSILPMDDYYCITAMINEKNEILLWYIDMIASQGIDSDSVPYFDDLYLDLVVYPDGCVMEDDRDELEEALSNNDITIEQFELANNTCNRLKTEVLSDLKYFTDYTIRCKNYIHMSQENRERYI